MILDEQTPFTAMERPLLSVIFFCFQSYNVLILKISKFTEKLQERYNGAFKNHHFVAVIGLSFLFLSFVLILMINPDRTYTHLGEGTLSLSVGIILMPLTEVGGSSIRHFHSLTGVLDCMKHMELNTSSVAAM